MNDVHKPGIAPPPAPEVNPRSLVLVNTGNGTEKSTAAYSHVIPELRRNAAIEWMS